MVIGVEFASIFAALGIDVTLIDTRHRLLPFLDREIVAILERELARLGIRTLHNERHTTVERLAGEAPRVRCTTKTGAVLVPRYVDLILQLLQREPAFRS